MIDAEPVPILEESQDEAPVPVEEEAPAQAVPVEAPAEEAPVEAAPEEATVVEEVKAVEPQPTQLFEKVPAPVLSQKRPISALPRVHKFKNEELEKKTAALQAEFNELLSTQNLTKRVAASFIDKDESFYSTMSEFYGGHRKHESPTRRLV